MRSVPADITVDIPHPAIVLQESRVSAVAGRALFGAMLLVVAMAPFSAGYPPLARLSWVSITNLQLAIYLLAIVWLFKLAADQAARARLLRIPLLLPTGAWVAAALVSSAFAEYGGMSLNYLYGLVAGVVIFLASGEALRGGARLFWAVGVLVSAGLVSAVAGLLEYAPWINIEPVLSPFKPQPTTVGGMLRLSGTFEYANGAAVYFETLLPVLLSLACALVLSSKVPRGRSTLRTAVVQGLLLVALCAFTMALVLTFSRAAWLGVAAGLVVFLSALAWKQLPRGSARVTAAVPRFIGLALGVMALATLYIYVTQPVIRLRLASEDDRSWYMSTIVPDQAPTLAANQIVTVPVTVRNDSPVLWYAGHHPAVSLSYHWMTSDKTQYAVFLGVRTPLPHDLNPGESIVVSARVWAPDKPGKYYLDWDLVQDGLTWFYTKSHRRPELTMYDVGVATAASSPDRQQASSLPVATVQQVENQDPSTVPRGELWSAALAMFRAHPITGVGPDAFRELYGKYAGKSEWNKNIYTNNTYIELFTNLGLLGGLAFVWLAGLALWRAFANLARTPVSAAWMVGLAATASLVALLVHGFLDYFLFSPPLYLVFWLLMQISVSWPRMVQAEQPTAKAD